MGAGDVTLICFSDGELIDENENAKYIGGYSKGDMVPSTIGFTSFKEKIREMINLPSNGIEFKIKCRVDLDDFTKIAIDVDNDTSLQFTMKSSKFIMAYIIKQMPPTTALTRTQREERNALSNLAVKEGPEYKPVRKTKSKLTMQCRDSGCNRRVQVIRSDNLPTFKVAKYQNLHTCSGLQRRGDGDHRQATIKWIASEMQSNIVFNDIDMLLKWEKEMSEIPLIIRDYIVYCEQIKGDGHCGYRSIAKLRGYDNETGWMSVRKELLNELHEKREKYIHQFHKHGVEQHVQNLQCTRETTFEKNEWFNLPDMGWLTANTYNSAFVVVHRSQSFTYLPLWTSPPPDTYPMMEIVHVQNDSHYMPIRFESTSPLPPETPGYFSLCDDVALAWRKQIEDRITLWKSLIQTKITTVYGMATSSEKIVVDLEDNNDQHM